MAETGYRIFKALIKPSSSISVNFLTIIAHIITNIKKRNEKHKDLVANERIHKLGEIFIESQIFIQYV